MRWKQNRGRRSDSNFLWSWEVGERKGEREIYIYISFGFAFNLLDLCFLPSVFCLSAGGALCGTDDALKL